MSQAAGSVAASEEMLPVDLGSLRRRRCVGNPSSPDGVAVAFVTAPWWQEAEGRLLTAAARRRPTSTEGSGRVAVVEPQVLALSLQKHRFRWPKRDPLADRKPSFQHFYPKRLMFTTLRGCVVAAAHPLHQGLMQITDELGRAEEDEDYKIQWPKWRELFKDYPYAAGAVIVRNLSVSSIMRGLEALAIRLMEPRWAGKFIKDVMTSAERKALRLGGKYPAAVAMLKTSAYASVILNLANLIYDLLQLGYELLVVKYPRYRIGPPPEPVAAELRPRKPLNERVTRILLVNLASYSIGTCGMALGTAIYPGMGTNIGGLTADFAQLLL